MAAPEKGLAQDLFEDMARKVEEASRDGVSEDEPKVVEEIESLCMNCHEDVGRVAILNESLELKVC